MLNLVLSEETGEKDFRNMYEMAEIFLKKYYLKKKYYLIHLCRWCWVSIASGFSPYSAYTSSWAHLCPKLAHTQG